MVLVGMTNSDSNSNSNSGLFRRLWWLSGGKQRRKGHKCLMVELMVVGVMEPVGRWW